MIKATNAFLKNMCKGTYKQNFTYNFRRLFYFLKVICESAFEGSRWFQALCGIAKAQLSESVCVCVRVCTCTNVLVSSENSDGNIFSRWEDWFMQKVMRHDIAGN